MRTAVSSHLIVNQSAVDRARNLDLFARGRETVRRNHSTCNDIGASPAGINVQEIVAIVDKTIKLIQLKPISNLAGGYTRVSKDASQSERLRVREDAAKELLLKLDDQKEPAQPEKNWVLLSQDLLREDTKIIHPTGGDTSQCITIRGKLQRHYANFLLQQF